MRSLARGCLLQLAVWAALSWGALWFLRDRGDDGGAAFAIAAAAGLCAALAVVVAHSVYGVIGERAMLRSADRGATLRDGAWVAVSGRIDSSSPLRAPMSGEEVIAYEYKVERWQKVGRGQSLLPWFDGKALAPSVIRTPHGPVRLLAVPRLEGERADISSSQAITKTSAYIRATTFEKRDTARERTAALEREWADDDGSFRRDRRHSETDPDLSEGFLLEELHITRGEEVCVFGVYSRDRAGLVPDRKWGRQARLVRGRAADVRAALLRRTIGWTITSVIFAAGALAILWFRVSHVIAVSS